MHVNTVVNLLVTRVPISIETSTGIVHSHIKIAPFIPMILTIFVFPFFINRTTTGSLDIGMFVGAA